MHLRMDAGRYGIFRYEIPRNPESVDDFSERNLTNKVISFKLEFLKHQVHRSGITDRISLPPGTTDALLMICTSVLIHWPRLPKRRKANHFKKGRDKSEQTKFSFHAPVQSTGRRDKREGEPLGLGGRKTPWTHQHPGLLRRSWVSRRIQCGRSFDKQVLSVDCDHRRGLPGLHKQAQIGEDAGQTHDGGSLRSLYTREQGEWWPRQGMPLREDKVSEAILRVFQARHSLHKRLRVQRLPQ